jgi:hypothetical protein
MAHVRKHNSQNETGLKVCLVLRDDYSPSRSSVQIITGGLQQEGAGNAIGEPFEKQIRG